MKYKLN